jgi:hypothetical protein
VGAVRLELEHKQKYGNQFQEANPPPGIDERTPPSRADSDSDSDPDSESTTPRAKATSTKRTGQDGKRYPARQKPRTKGGAKPEPRKERKAISPEGETAVAIHEFASECARLRETAERGLDPTDAYKAARLAADLLKWFLPHTREKERQKLAADIRALCEQFPATPEEEG